MSEDNERPARRSEISGSSLSALSPTRSISKSASYLKRSLSPSRHHMSAINPLNLLGGPGSTKKRSETSSSHSSASKKDSNERDSIDCGKPVTSMAKSIVTMLTAASMYVGMDIDNNEDIDADGAANEEEEVDVDDSQLEEDLAKEAEDMSLNEENQLDYDLKDEEVEQDRGNLESLIQHSFSRHSTGNLEQDIQGPVKNDEAEKSAKVTGAITQLRRRSSLFELSIVEKLASAQSDKTVASTERAIAICEKLRSTFDIGEDEAYLGDFSCWLLRDVLLQGHLYLTSKHLLFFAFLPRKQGNVAKSGSLGIRSYPSRRVSRKWAVLRDSTLSFYSSSTDLYFPTLTIDLQYALRAEVVNHKSFQRPKGTMFFGGKHALSTTWFKLLTESKTYIFQADSCDSANDWVSTLRKHIFAAKNKGNHVTIKIPLPNIMDLELTHTLETSKTLRLNVMESFQTFAIDDYYLMFLQGADAAAEAIKNAISAEKDEAPSRRSDSVDPLDEEEEEETQGDEETESSVSSSRATRKSSGSGHHFHRPSLSKLKKSLSSRQARRSLGESSEQASADSVVEKVVKYDDEMEDEDEIPEIVNEGGDIKQVSSERLVSGISEFQTPDQGPNAAANFSLETNVEELDQIYKSQHSRWNPKSLVKGVISTTSFGISHVGNLTTMWSATPNHYNEANSLERGTEDPYLIKDPQERLEATERFLKHFSLPESSKLISSYFAHLIKNVPVYGKVYLGDQQICFRSLLPGTSTLMILPFSDVENVYKEKGFRFGYSGLVIVIHGHEELFFEFGSTEARDDCEALLLKQIDIQVKKLQEEQLVADDKKNDVKLADSVSKLADAKVKLFENRISSIAGINVPIILDNHPYCQTDFKPRKAYKFTLLTIGSRGDVQPYIALGKGLLKEGHEVKIVTHEEFQPWIEKHGLQFAPIAGDPGELMSLMVTHGTMSVAFLKEASAKFRGWITELLSTSWEACQGTDILIESPSAMGGIHIAEALRIPYFRAFTMPWTRTRAYPHAFIVPDQKRGGSYNYLTHVMFENVFWKGISGQVNKWRVETLGLPKTNLEHLQQTKVPFLYNISPTVFPPSVDFASWIKVTGYWFLDEGNIYTPPEELLTFMKKAREDGKKLVYIGFGSIVVSDPKQLTEAIVEAVLDSDVRCILNKGWSNRLGDPNSKQLEVPLPPSIYNSGAIPHDWLFGQIDAAVHHGGSGTTGATLRAGLPTIIKPFFGDQFFYANRVVDIGAGIAVKKLNAKSLAKALKEATSNARIMQKAKDIGVRIREENGVSLAIATIYSELEYSKKLILSKKEVYGDILDKQNEEMEKSAANSDDSWAMV